MGLRQHETYINQAATADVDAVQAGNAVRVSMDQGFAALFASLNLNPARDPGMRAAAAALDSTPAAPAPPPPLQVQARRMQHPAPAVPARLLQLPDNLQNGAEVVIPQEVWPSYRCRELGGAGWAATIVRMHASAALVRFNAGHQTRDGRRYADELLPHSSLRVLADASAPGPT